MAKAKPASGIAADIAAMKAIGMSDEQVQAKLMGAAALPQANGGMQTVPTGSATPQPLTAPQRQDQAALGPDPEVVARHNAFLANYKPPVLEEVFRVTLDKRRADYVRRWAGWQSALRKGETITPEKAIDLMVRRLWQLDPDRQQMGANSAVPRSQFSHPPIGTPPSVPQG